MIKRLISIILFFIITLSSINLGFKVEYLGSSEVRGSPAFINETCTKVSELAPHNPIIFLAEDLQIWAGPIFAGCKVPVQLRNFAATESLYLAVVAEKNRDRDPLAITSFPLKNSVEVKGENLFVERARGRTPQALEASTSYLAITNMHKIESLEQLDSHLTPMINLGERYETNSESPRGNRAILSQGWSGAENWGTWADGASATIQFALAGELQDPTQSPVCVHLSGRSFLAAPGSNVEIIYLRPNSEPLSFQQKPNSDFVISLQSNPGTNGVHKILLEFPSPVSPLQMGLSEDNRRLSIAMMSITVEENCVY